MPKLLLNIYLLQTFLMVALHVHIYETADPYSITQLSPRSKNVDAKEKESYKLAESDMRTQSWPVDSSSLHLADTSSVSTAVNQFTADTTGESSDLSPFRQRRSALPILNDREPVTASRGGRDLTDEVSGMPIESNDVEITDGRYLNTIAPTRVAYDQHFVVQETQVPDTVHRYRMSKDLEHMSDAESAPFLEQRGPAQNLSGPPMHMPTNNVPQTWSNVSAPKAATPNSARQNQNPDIQDIITGIVKLLNGNVNVHANTQVTRRPFNTRINNRGPPRISEAQPYPPDIDNMNYASTKRPQMPPYPFDRPDGAVRPFLNGVPLPEQIVPSLQQYNRPGFISQNRPPWQQQRPLPSPPLRPAPPGHSGPNRRPMPPFKQVPAMPDDDLFPTTIEPSFTEINSGETANNTVSLSVPPTEASISDKKRDELTKKKDKINISKASTEKSTTAPAPATATVDPLIVLSSDVKAITEPQQPATNTSFDMSADIMPSMVELLPHDTEPHESSQPETVSVATQMLLAPSSTIATAPDTVVASTQLTRDQPKYEYHPRPGIVLDDPEFKPGGGGGGQARPPQPPANVQRPWPPVPVQSTRPLPQGYGEIFDVTLSAVQGPGGGGGGPGAKQTIKIRPYGGGGENGADIIVSQAGNEEFVSIDGKRTYINLFGEQTEAPNDHIQSTPAMPAGITGTGYAVAENDVPVKQTPHRKPASHYRPHAPQPPVRIDTCIVGDDSTCDQTQNEKCKTEFGVSSCHCRPGYARRKDRDPCRRVVSLLLSLRVDKIYDKKIVWDRLLGEKTSEPFGQLSFESMRAIDSAMSMTPFSDEFLEAKVNKIYLADAATQGSATAAVFVNLTLSLEENGDTLRPGLKSDIQRHLLGVIHRRNNNVGNSALYVDNPAGAISNLQDLDECTSQELNDCHPEASCSNIWGSYRCECPAGLRDPWSDQVHRAGRECHSCSDNYCNNRGVCSYDNGNQVCNCAGSFYGSQCEIDGEVLGVAVGASVAAVIIIILTLICLVMWSRRWHREQKNAIGSPVFGYMTAAQVKTPAMGQTPYQVTLEDRMRWAQIADVMAQANHYGAEPVASARNPSLFDYPNFPTLNNMGGTMGQMSMAGTLPMGSGTLPPVPLPRLALHSRSNGMRTLENSESSSEEDRADLLGNFQVPRPKSRSNGSVTNQSGIYYDVDYAPTSDRMYTTHGSSTVALHSNASHSMPGPQGIPMSTYTSGRAPSTYYMK